MNVLYVESLKEFWGTRSRQTHTFVYVIINPGSALQHERSSAMLRACRATSVDIAVQFGHTFFLFAPYLAQ